MHLWHDIPLGNNPPDEINAVIEVPMGSKNKYEIKKETGKIEFDRTNSSSITFPFNYGFIPQTLWDDGDALDVVVLTEIPLETEEIINVRPIGLLEMIDNKESDFKIISIPINNNDFEAKQEIEDLTDSIKKEIINFFETYKEFKENNKIAIVEIKGIKDKEKAKKVINEAANQYKKSKKVN